MTYTDKWAYWRFYNKHEDLGKFGEALWSRVFIESGLMYVPLKDLPPMHGKGPRLQGADVTLPDFDVTTKKRRLYVDSKCKWQSVLFKKANELRHGIDRKSWDAYCTISTINRQRCVLGIVELFNEQDAWSGSLLVQTLAVLSNPIQGFSDQSHMVYWARDRFEILAEGISPLDIWTLANGTTPLPEAIKHKLIAFTDRGGEPPMQARLFA